MKVLNLYAGIGGNRKLWTGCEVTAVEIDPKIAEVYKKQYPQDNVVIGDAHAFLLEHLHEYDFIWSSPTCQSHTRMQWGQNRTPTYPKMDLYQQIIFLNNFYDGKWVVENVVPYYEPLIPPYKKVGRHLFWCNFRFEAEDIPQPKNFIMENTLAGAERLKEWLGIHYEGSLYYDGNHSPVQVLRNAVHPGLSIQIYDQMRDQPIQGMLWEVE